MSPRIDVDPAAAEPGAFYRLLTSVVVPRPIAWISTRSAAGVDNLAPHSFFTVACNDPPIVQFTSVGRKDTLRNAEATGELVFNITTSALLETVNATSIDAPPDVSEFDLHGIAREPSLRVAPPRVADSPVALECVLEDTRRFGACTVVFGRVVHAAVAEEVMRDGRARIELLRPLARLGGREWSEIGTVREIVRPRWQDRER